MKNFKNIFIAIVSIVGFLSIQSSKAELSYNERRFVEDTKNKKVTPIMKTGGVISDEWLSGAVFMILNGNTISDKNKDYVLNQLSEMIDILVGALLRSKENVSDAQYAEIMFNIDSQVRTFIYNLIKNNQQSTVASAPNTDKLTFESILNGALGESYASKAKTIYNSNVSAYVDGLFRDVNVAINARYQNESTRTQAIQRAIDKYSVYLERSRTGNVQALSPVVKFTLESILNGALGEPYTSKANEVYNSNVPAYANGLVKEINAAINAQYQKEATRTQALQRAIDKYYVHLERSRR